MFWLFVSLSCFPPLCVSLVPSLLSGPFFASDSSGRRLVRVVRALAPPLSLSPSVLLPASPSGVVPGLSGRRLVRISSATLISLLSFSPLPPSSLTCFLVGTLDSAWYFWPQTGQGYHIAGSLVKQSPPTTKHVLWPQTGPGRCCSPHTHGTPYKTASRAVMV